MCLKRVFHFCFPADCKASEVKEFTAEYLEKVLEPSGWQAVWRTNVFEVLVEVGEVDLLAYYGLHDWSIYTPGYLFI